MDEEKIRELLPQLKELIEKKSPKSKKIIEDLENAGYKGDVFDEIKKTIGSYSFKKAIELLKNL